MKKVSKQHVELEIHLDDLVNILKSTGWISKDEVSVDIESIKYKVLHSLYQNSKPSKLIIKYKSSKVLKEDKVRYELPEGSAVKSGIGKLQIHGDKGDKGTI